MFKVIVAGGRDFNNYKLLEYKLDALLINKEKSEIVIISGMAKGADSLALIYAEKNNLKVEKYAADWDQYGKSAGYKRNQQMADNANALIAFWDGQSRGTKHMIDIATKAKLQVRVISY